MKLLTAEINAKLLANAAQTRLAQESGGNEPDHKPVLKIFNALGNQTWLISELMEDGDTMFGLFDLGLGTPELGYVSLSELQSLRRAMIERDLYFRPEMTIGEYAAKARIDQYIDA